MCGVSGRRRVSFQNRGTGGSEGASALAGACEKESSETGRLGELGRVAFSYRRCCFFGFPLALRALRRASSASTAVARKAQLSLRSAVKAPM